MADWHWKLKQDDLLEGLPPEARAKAEHLAEEIATRDSIVYLDGSSYTGHGPGLRIESRGGLVLTYITDVRAELVLIVQVAWMG